MFKKGTSVIHNRSHEAEFEDVVRFLDKSGANVRIKGNDIFVEGPCSIKGIDFTTISDKNDFATWAMAIVATRSKGTLTSIQPKLMNIDPLLPILKTWKVKIRYDNDSATIDATSAKLTPIDIVAGQYPLFHTDWQPLLAPVLTQIKGDSSVIDAVYDNRLQHFTELGKMGSKYEFFSSPEYPSKSGTPRAVKVTGPVKLVGTTVKALDVRAGAAMAIAALIAEGETTITHTEHIDRGYENFCDRLKNLGVKCAEN
jgi:UDP-N-acetylglucosamine 1-carboxyvinyltransferase